MTLQPDALPPGLLRRHHVLVGGDNPFQQRARLLQALWREENGHPVGLHRGEPLGSRLPMPYAQEGLHNYLTETVRDVVRAEVLDRARAAGKLYGRPRIFNDLLSSQPLCFNLFGEMQRDLDLATRALRSLFPRVQRVTGIAFEHSPGRGDVKYTGDRSAFDVFVEYAGPNGERGFLGVEVKYHEDLAGQAAEHRARYDELADAEGCFLAGARTQLQAQPLQQIWRDHLLAIALVRAGERDEGTFVFLYPRDNERCDVAVDAYERCLADRATFQACTLETLVDAIRAAGAGGWIENVQERYLDFERLGSAG